MPVYRLGDVAPDIAESAFIAPDAVLIGSVVVGENASIWFGALLRGDNEPIRIGEGSNVQEGAVLHTDPGFPMEIGAGVSVGHQAMLHGCRIGDDTLVGIQAIVMNGAVIGRQCLVGAGAVVTQGKSFPDRSLIMGVPAKAVRELSDEDVAEIEANARDYVQRQQRYKATLARIG